MLFFRTNFWPQKRNRNRKYIYKNSRISKAVAELFQVVLANPTTVLKRSVKLLNECECLQRAQKGPLFYGSLYFIPLKFFVLSYYNKLLINNVVRVEHVCSLAYFIFFW